MSSFDTGSTESQAPSSVLTAGTGASIDDESEQSWTTLKAQAKAINDQYTGFSNGKGGFNAGFFDGLVVSAQGLTFLACETELLFFGMRAAR